jgi:alpha 1,3-mannosyltransferase
MIRTQTFIALLAAFLFLSFSSVYARDNDSAQERSRSFLETKKKKAEREKLEKEQREKEQKEKQEKEQREKAGQVYEGTSSKGGEKKSVSNNANKDRAVEKAGFGLSIAACRKLASKSDRRECVQEKNRKKHRRPIVVESNESKELKEFKEKRNNKEEKESSGEQKPSTATE